MSSPQPLLRTQRIQSHRYVKHVNNITDFSSKPLEWKSLSIDAILCEDLILHILSFSGFCHTKRINILWNQLSQTAEKIHVKNQVRAFENKNTSYDRKINTTYIITSNRKSLYEWEQTLQWKIWNGTIDDITIDINKHLNNQITSGDRFVLYDGIYETHYSGIQINESNHNEFDCEDKCNVSFIGVGQKVIIKVCEYKGDNVDDEVNRTFISTGINCDIYVQNLTIDCREMDYSICSHIVIKPFSMLTMNNCKLFMGGNGIDIWWGCQLKLDSCHFIGGSVAVDITTSGSVNIKNCVFKNNGQDREFESSQEMSCIQIKHLIQDKLGSKLRLDCKGNKFINNLCFPIAEKHKDNGGISGNLITHKYSEMSNLYVLEDNILIGFNATSIDKDVNVTSANKIYLNDFPERYADLF